MELTIAQVPRRVVITEGLDRRLSGVGWKREGWCCESVEKRLRVDLNGTTALVHSLTAAAAATPPHTITAAASLPCTSLGYSARIAGVVSVMKRRCLQLLSARCCAGPRRHCVQLTASSLVRGPRCALPTTSTDTHSAFFTTAGYTPSAPHTKDVSTPTPPHSAHPSSPLTRLPPVPPATIPTATAAAEAAADCFYTLGLDINTQSIGYVLLSPSLHTVHCGVISLSHLPSSSSPAARLRHVTEQLRAVLAVLPPQARLHTAVESYLLSFSGRRFQTRHLFQLAAFNSLVQCQLWHLTGEGQWPAVVNVNSARSRFGLRGEVTEGKGGRKVSDVKSVVWRWVDERLRRERDSAAEGVDGTASAAGTVEMEWRRKRDGSVHATMYDISDAYLIALTAAIDRHQQHMSEPAAAAETVASVRDSDGGASENVNDGMFDREVSTRKKPRVRKVSQARSIASSSSSSTSNGSTETQKGRRRRIVASE